MIGGLADLLSTIAERLARLAVSPVVLLSMLSPRITSLPSKIERPVTKKQAFSIAPLRDECDNGDMKIASAIFAVIAAILLWWAMDLFGFKDNWGFRFYGPGGMIAVHASDVQQYRVGTLTFGILSAMMSMVCLLKAPNTPSTPSNPENKQ